MLGRIVIGTRGSASKRFAISFAAAIAALSTAAPASAGEWIRDEKAQCEVWNPNPQPGESIAWTGPCVNGRAEGKGNLSWYQDGKVAESYDGEMKGGKTNGDGVYKYADGNSYDGQWKDEIFNGHGTLKTSDGTIFEGEWKNGEFHEGTQNFTSGDKLVGEFVTFSSDSEWHTILLKDGFVISKNGEKRKMLTGFGSAILGMPEDAFAALGIGKKFDSKGASAAKNLCAVLSGEADQCYFETRDIGGRRSIVTYVFFGDELGIIQIDVPLQIYDRSDCFDDMNRVAQDISKKYGQFDSSPKRTVSSGDFESYNTKISFPGRQLKFGYIYFASGESRYYHTKCLGIIQYMNGVEPSDDVEAPKKSESPY